MKKKPKNKDTESYRAWELLRLKNKCLRLWKKVVKAKAGYKCEFCGVGGKYLNAHHIEDKDVCKALRYDPVNGIACCPTHHKWGQHSYHRSFIFTHNFILTHRPEDLYYLQAHRNDKLEITKEYLIEQISCFEKLIRTIEDEEKA